MDEYFWHQFFCIIDTFFFSPGVVLFVKPEIIPTSPDPDNAGEGTRE